MKIWPIITPIMTILFSTFCPKKQNINMQIRYSVYIYTLRLMGNHFMDIFTHIA